jgi:hypothetical protein
VSSKTGETELIVDRTDYDIVRTRSGVSTLWSVERKIRWCGYFLLTASLLVPITVLLPEAVIETYIGEEPLFTPLSVAGLAALSVVTLFGAAVGLFWVAYRGNRADEITKDEAWRLVGLEEVFSAFAFLMGFVGVAICVADVSAGMWGAEFVASLAESGVVLYRGDSAFAVPVAYVSAQAFFAGVVVLGLAAYATSLSSKS